MDRLKRIFCLFLALAFLLTAPGVVPVKTEADAVVAGLTALGAAGVVGATLLGLGVKPGTSSTDWDSTVSNTVDHLKTLGYVTADGLMQVLKFANNGSTVDEFKTAITTDVVTACAQFLSSSNVVVSQSSQSSAMDFSVNPFGDYEFSIKPNVGFPVSIFYCEIIHRPSSDWSGWNDRFISHYVCCLAYSFASFRVNSNPSKSFSSSGSTIYFSGLGSKEVRKDYGFPKAVVTHSSGFSGDELAQFAFEHFGLISGLPVGSSSTLDLNVSAVPAGFTNVTTAYPSWVSSAVTDNSVTYLPISITLPGTGVIPTTPQPTTAEPEPTKATPDEDKVIPITPDILSGMFEGLKGWLQSLLNSILEAIQAIPEKIDSLWESMKAWWTQTIADVKAWIEVKIQSISDWWTTFWAETKATIASIAASITEFFTVTFPAWITDVKEWALALPKTLVDAIVLALTAVFVPAVGYWDAKVAALQAKFPLFNSILTTGKGFSGFFSGLGTRPPVIYIDLGSSASWAMGGRTIFLDLTWYSQYKPTMDLVIAGFLWLLFAWRFFLRLPGLLRGEVGTIDRLDSYLSEKRKKNGG